MPVTWWVGEQFQPDGSAIYDVMSDSGSVHPQPGPNQIIYGPYPNQLLARAAENRAGQLAAQHVYRGSNVSPGPGGTNLPKNQGPPNVVPALTPLGSIGDFFHRLTEKETWIRVGEVALGGILIYAGVRALSSGTAVGQAAKSAAKPVKKVAKATKTTAKVAATRKPPAPKVSHIYHHKAAQL